MYKIEDHMNRITTAICGDVGLFSLRPSTPQTKTTKKCFHQALVLDTAQECKNKLSHLIQGLCIQ